MPLSVSERVHKRRNAMRDAGLRPVQIWVPDTRSPDFARECARQSQLVSQIDSDLGEFMDVAIADLNEWK